MISAAHADCVENVDELVETSRRVVKRAVPIAVGGPILELESVDVLTETLADYAVSDPGEALGFCRLGAAAREWPALRERVG